MTKHIHAKKSHVLFVRVDATTYRAVRAAADQRGQTIARWCTDAITAHWTGVSISPIKPKP